MRPAGQKLLHFVNTPLGEELTEGTVGGLMAGSAGLFSDQPMEQTALQTAAAVAGGIGLGIAGRRIGAYAGRKLHPGALKDQQGAVANLGRMLGSETTIKGLEQQGALAKSAITEGLREAASTQMLREAATDPTAFTQKYGISAADFQAMAPNVQAGRMVSSAIQALESVPVEARQRLVKDLTSEYERVEKLIGEQAANRIDQLADETSRSMKSGMYDDDLRTFGVDGQQMTGFVERLKSGQSDQVTGEQVGRAIGRMIGDEVGILGGMTAGYLASQQMGFESPKDATIRKLEEQLAKK